VPESPAGTRDSDPPIDSDGQVIGDVPWKFFEPSRERAAPGRSEDCAEVEDDVREVAPGLWTSGPSLVELDAYDDYGDAVDEGGT
jgi:hypothetical protein